MKNICFQMNRKAWLAIAMVLCLSFPALAQKITVQGTVVDPAGEPLIGASVLAQGSSVGTATDFDGNFTIEVNPEASLVVSYVGYNTQTVAVNGRTKINITLEENTVVLEEVVAIGYGVVKKEDATGSVSMVKPDEIEAGLATSAQDLLVGASPGVVVTSNGGSPTGGATIRIRGGSSLNANNNPLVVIDGVPMTDMSYSGTDAMTMVAPDNIESMTILKDASATAIYGSRASNGVIIITTKKGKSGKPQVNFSANFHVNTARNTLDLMDGNQYRAAIEKYVGTPEALAKLGTANTDWQKEVLRTSFSHDYNLSVGGTVGFLPYRVSASFTDNQGILKTSSMQRTTAGITLTPKFFNGKLSITANVKGAYIKTRNANQGSIGAAASFNPTLPVYSGQEIYNGYTNLVQGNGAPETNASQNPLQMLEDEKATSEILRSNGNIQFDYALHFLPELHFNLNLGYDVAKSTSNTTIAQNSIQAWRSNYSDGAGTFYDGYQLNRNTMLNFYANYKKEFEAIKSDLDVMAGYEWQRMDYHGRGISIINTLGYVNDWASIYNNGQYTLTEDPATADHVGKTYNNGVMDYWGNRLQLVSFFGRVNYDFDDTYLLTFTLRNDGTSRFHKDSRWGLFPSLALGWKIINMPFMEKAQDVMNDFKLRLGWGVTGQQDINSYFPYMATYAISQQYGYYPSPNGDGTWIAPLYPKAYDEKIKWEETTTWNVGVDMAFLSNRITASLDWYLRDTDDLLAWVPVAAGMTTSNYMNRNIGSLRNIGIEATVGAKPIVTKDFTWNTTVNVAWNKNEITKLTGNAETDSPVQATNTPSGTGTGLQWHMIGEPAYTYRVYQQVYDADGNPLEGQYVDQNGDGQINSSDLINYHSPDPKVTLSWNNTFNYKNWDLGIVLRANIGNYVYNNPRYERTRPADIYVPYGLTNLLNDEYLFTQVDGNRILSDYWVENASFIRCDNISLGYTWPELLNNALRLRLFGAVQNPFVITKYKGLDPEVQGGIDNNVYPRPVTFSLGVVATF